MHVGYEKVRDELDNSRPESPAHDEVAWVELAQGDSAWDPVREGEKLWGPGVIEYRCHPDGGVTAIEHGEARL